MNPKRLLWLADVIAIVGFGVVAVAICLWAWTR